MKSLLTAFLIVLCTLNQTIHGDEPPPNVILILADDLGFETLGCYGGLSYKTPNLDRLAETGLRFTHAYAQPLCTNTRVQLMTGKYNDRNWKAFGILDPREKTIGHFMSSAGYATLIAGKWQLQSYDPPDYPGAELRRDTGMRVQDAGFDEYSLWHTSHTELKGSRYADPVILENGKFRTDTKGRYGPDIWAEVINDFVTRKQKRPFFVYFPMALPHGPFEPTPHSAEWKDRATRHKADDRFYGDMVEYMDTVVGRIVDHVDSLKLKRRTVILFFGDNGTPQEATSKTVNRTIPGGKGLPTDAGTRVPLIVRWTGQTPAGFVCDDLVDSTDFLPTILEAAGSKAQLENIDGRSFYPRLIGERGSPRETIFFHYDPRPGWDKDQFTLHRFARTKRFKLYDDGRLFDIPNDPFENLPIREADDDAITSAARKKLQSVFRSRKL